MRLLHTADPHLGKTTHSTPGTVSRASDFAQTLMRFVKVAIEQKVDAAVVAGDIFHNRRPLPRDLSVLTEALAELRNANILALLTSGNHDGMDIVGDERTHALAWMRALQPKGVRLYTSPTYGQLQVASGERFNIVTVPYPHKRSFDAVMPDKTPEQRTEEISRVLERSIQSMIEAVRTSEPALPTLFIGHLSVIGAALGSETTMRFGWDVTLRSGVFDDVDYAALGHIHRQQQLSPKAWYAGSPEYMDFGEQGQRKGFLLVTMEQGKVPVVEVIDSKPRPMVTLNLVESDGIFDLDESVPDGAIVNLIITPEESISPAAVMAQVRWIRDKGASFVQYRVVTPERRSTRAVVDAQVDRGEALRRWLTANNHSTEPALSAGLQLMREVDGEA